MRVSWWYHSFQRMVKPKILSTGSMMVEGLFFSDRSAWLRCRGRLLSCVLGDSRRVVMFVGMTEKIEFREGERCCGFQVELESQKEEIILGGEL